jgi:hypothetical protein
MNRIFHFAHFGPNSTLRTYRTVEYGSLTVLDFEPNCTKMEKFYA